MSEVSQANRRIHSRRRTRIATRMLHGSDAVQGTIENLGAGGVFFATEDLELALEDGADVCLVFSGRRAGKSTDFAPTGTVLRSERYFDGEAVVRAFAVKFHELLDLSDVEFD